SLVAPLPVFRLDSDTASERAAVTRILGRFEQAEAGVLVGTQMVAKGHDFPDVTLGVVLDADSTLRFPDFRSEERTFALVAQLAGRSGRGKRGGRVVVQALDASARALQGATALRSLIGLDDAQVLGPAPLFRLQGRERSQIVVKAQDRSAAVSAVRAAVEQVAGERAHKGVAFAVDVDPQ